MSDHGGPGATGESGVSGHVAWALACVGLLSLVQGGIEAVLVARAGAEPSSFVLAGLLSASLTMLLGLAAAPGLVAIALAARHLCDRRAGQAWAGLVLAVPSVLVAVAITDPRGRVSPLLYGALALVAAALMVAAGWLGVAKPRRNAQAAALVLAVSAGALDVMVGGEAYPEVHGLAFVVLGAALASLLADLRAMTVSWARLGLAIALSCAVSLALLVAISSTRPTVYSWSVLHGRNVVRAAAWMRAPFDRDGDGFAPVLWGHDCNDRDGRVYPGAPDPPGNGDQNCNGVDGAAQAPASFFTGQPAGPAHLPRGAIDRVLLLTLDTFRPELLRDDVMPNLERFVRQGVQFRRSYASATATLASLPLFHRATLRSPSIAESLERAGIATHAFGTTGFVRTKGGRSDEQLAKLLLDALSSTGREPRFVWAHFMGMHADYKRWPDAPSPPHISPFSPAYLSEAMHLDGLLAPVLAWLSEPGRLARSVVLVSGDHGEGFGEHGAFSHARLAWQEMIRTPIVVLAPGLAPGVQPHLASHRDVPATILGAFGLAEQARDAERFGRSMLRMIGHESRPLRTGVVSHSSRQASGALGYGPLGILIDGNMKLVVGVTDGVMELYDLASDPGERRNLATARPHEAARLARKLYGYLDAEGYPGLPPGSLRMGEAAR